MKLQTAKPVLPSARCSHRTSTGRQCRLPVSDAQSVLCPRHHADHIEGERADVSNLLFNPSQGFQTAQGINYSLRNLYWLVAQNRLSTRRASVLAYIGSLLLRTLPAIDSDRDAGIIDPADPPNESVPAPTDTHSHASSAATDTSRAKVPATPTGPGPATSSIPEPDLTRKPS
jgi:hypothetical protein